MKIKTKYNIDDKVKYYDEEFVDNGTCKCCQTQLQDMKKVKTKGVIENIQISVEKEQISIEYKINDEFIDEKEIIRKIIKAKR